MNLRPERLADIARLRFGGGLAAPAIGAALGLPATAVEAALDDLLARERARRHLAAVLAGARADLRPRPEAVRRGGRPRKDSLHRLTA